MTLNLSSILNQYSSLIAQDQPGIVSKVSRTQALPCLRRVIQSLPTDYREVCSGTLHSPSPYRDFAQWVLSLSPADRDRCGLGVVAPPSEIHFIAGETGLFYDFKNTDILVEELENVGAELTGHILDFGCSSGRNIASLHRVFGDQLIYHGCDPVPSSIAWASDQFPYAAFIRSMQTPPLSYAAASFDLVIAKSIWTHFSESAARNWFAEIARILKPGGFFFFSTHGPHDIAYRLAYDIPSPNYANFAGDDHWTKDRFLKAVLGGLEDRGFYFQPFKPAVQQGDLSKIKESDTSDWGLTFMLKEFLTAELLPPELTLVSHSVGRTGNRHDAYVVQKHG